MTPRINNEMTAYERFLTRVYAVIFIVALLVLATDLFYWRPDKPVHACNKPERTAGAKTK